MAWWWNVFRVLLVPDSVHRHYDFGVCSLFLGPSSDTARYSGPGMQRALNPSDVLGTTLWSASQLDAKLPPYQAVMQPVKMLSMVQL